MKKYNIEELSKIILDILSKYEALKLSQVERMILKICPDNNRIEISRAIKILTNNGQATLREDIGYLYLYNNSNPDQTMLSCFWILCEFMSVINYQDTFKAKYPSEIYFIKDGSQYEIMAPRVGEEYQINIIKEKNSKLDERDKVKLIILVADEEQSRACASYIGELDVLFAQIDDPNSDNPEISFYTIEIE